MGDEIKSGSANEPKVEGFIGKAELARRLGVAPRTVDAWMARGLIVYVKAGRAVRFRWSRVLAHMESHFEVRAKGKC